MGRKRRDVELIDNDMKPVKLSSFRGKVLVLSSVHSLDTSVCDVETKKFNQLASDLNDVVVVTVSMDLPFAQKRWCGAVDAKNVITLSDYRGARFGSSYGVLIKEVYLLARCVFVVDKNGVIQYIQLVPEVASEPNYDAVVAAVKKLV